MIRIIDIVLLSLVILSGIINVSRSWDNLRDRKERFVTILYLVLLASVHLNLVTSHIVHGPIHWGFYLMAAVFTGMLWVSLRRNILHKGRK